MCIHSALLIIVNFVSVNAHMCPCVHKHNTLTNDDDDGKIIRLSFITNFQSNAFEKEFLWGGMRWDENWILNAWKILKIIEPLISMYKDFYNILCLIKFSLLPTYSSLCMFSFLLFLDAVRLLTNFQLCIVYI